MLIILGVAMGLTSFLVDAQVPTKALHWVQEHIHSKLLFLLALNAALLLVGALMDIFSAIIVVVPLIAPMGLAFGIDPVHLGIIFLVNLELEVTSAISSHRPSSSSGIVPVVAL